MQKVQVYLTYGYSISPEKPKDTSDRFLYILQEKEGGKNSTNSYEVVVAMFYIICTVQRHYQISTHKSVAHFFLIKILSFWIENR